DALAHRPPPGRRTLTAPLVPLVPLAPAVPPLPTPAATVGPVAPPVVPPLVPPVVPPIVVPPLVPPIVVPTPPTRSDSGGQGHLGGEGNEAYQGNHKGNHKGNQQGNQAHKSDSRAQVQQGQRAKHARTSSLGKGRHAG
ncbi:MAG: hypothetical protein JWP14_2374, partial [Frankiales bacterium]|nr:hypothetical protein [Frankiales bacterium]